VADEAGRAHEDADSQVRSHRPRRSLPDELQQGGHAQRPEDQADEAAEEPDRGSRDHGCSDVEHGPRPVGRADRPPPAQEVDSAVEQNDGDRQQERGLRDDAREIAAEHGAGDRGRRHPCEEPPVDAPGSNVHGRGGRSRHARDRDVGGAACRGRGREGNDDRQPDVSEDEPDQAAENRDHERPQPDEDELYLRASLGTRHLGEPPSDTAASLSAARAG
jgi:hypothetical protein